MPDKDDDSLTEIPSMVPDSDELADRRAQQAPRKPAPKKPGGGGGFLWWSVLLVLLVGLLGLGFLLNQTSNRLKREQAQLDDYQQRIAVLEKKLSVTDQSVSTSSTAMRAKIGDLDSEIRKLWDNVWKRSKKELAEHDAQIDKLDARIGKLNAAEDAQDKTVKALNSRIGETQLSMKVLSDQLDAAGDIPTQLKALNSQLDGIESDLAKMKALQAKLGKRVDDVEGWVASFNAYRRQVNNKLLNLQNSVSPPAKTQQ